ncbi:hypothetical protein CAPTEDRAFT_186282 [Capitella teleta]|uniref:Uncharacterized protein n=1 Tax=Capitella teleta TaxID=283909 RepID=R7VFB2_CAPTE|nr:hypothetical protein CAPTEDRAFT_186282 [Capitella teleta]|eukprot:ELU14996.1 hypothetical protein CAPTEDRAFT_186282 [Capitella teleta]
MDNKRKDSFFDEDDDFYYNKTEQYELPVTEKPEDIRAPSLNLSDYSDDFEDSDESVTDKEDSTHKEISESQSLPESFASQPKVVPAAPKPVYGAITPTLSLPVTNEPSDKLPPIKKTSNVSSKVSPRRGQSQQASVVLPPISDSKHWNGVQSAPRNAQWRAAKTKHTKQTKQTAVTYWMRKPLNLFQPKRSHPLLDAKPAKRKIGQSKANVIRVRAQGPMFNF